MSKSLTSGAKSLAVVVALFAVSLSWQKAAADSPYDGDARDYLWTGYSYAVDEYDYGADPTGADLNLVYYAYYADYYANLAYTNDDPYLWYDAYLCGYYGYLYACDTYDATGDYYAYQAKYYLFAGYYYAYDSLLYFQ